MKAGGPEPLAQLADLEAAEDKYAKITRVSPLAIGVTELSSGLVLEVNAAFERTFKVSREQVVGHSMARFWRDPADRQRMLQIIAEQGCVRDYEIASCTYAGEPLVVLLNSELLQIDETECLVTFAQDITEQRRLEVARRESEEKFAKAFHAAPYGVSLVDLETDHYLDVNEGFERLFGCKREHVVGKRVTNLPFWADPEERRRYVEMVRRVGSVREMPAKGRSLDGTPRRGLASAVVVEIGGRPCMLTFARDVTEQLETERARSELEAQLRDAQKLEALGTLAGGIAHDFNNILSAIMAYAELIDIDKTDAAAVKGYVGELQTASRRARDLVRQILTFSRRQTHERRPARLGVVVTEAIKLLRSTLPATLQLESWIASDTPLVMADLSQIHQIVMNLCTNAAHAIGANPGRISIKLERVEISDLAARSRPDLRPGRNTRLTVSDTGCGMDEYTCKRIFEPFFTTKAPGEGTGLGLAVVHGIVRDHEGAIDVHSRPGEGTTFELHFPEHPPELNDESELSTTLLRGRGEHVLVVDDEPALRFAIVGLLERLGYRATARPTPLEAIESFGRDPTAYDLVLTDLTMPTMTGVDMAKQMLITRPETRILVMSGYSPTWTAETLRQIGVRDLLMKPITVLSLSSKVRDALDAPLAR
ncbi:MAG TPA: PAS domain S-box protein [Polyangiales bacterium]|nr:PAS domain S-box protein [Polyangiales bacterium]